jgi:hypothetical protein
MADLSSLVGSAAQGTGSPQGSLASLLQSGSQLAPPIQRAPAPTSEQTIAGYHRAQEIKQRMAKVLANPKAGHDNIRPLVLEAGADLIGSKVMTLAALMKGLSDFPGADNPLAQKQWVRHLIAVNSFAQRKLLMDHRAANPPDYQHGTPWSADDHDDQMAALMAHYPSQS